LRALIDCDVLLDVGLDRMPWADASSAALKLALHSGFNGFVAWHSLSNLDYLLKRDGDRDPRPFISELLSFLQVAPVGHADMQYALELEIADLEDAMQAAAAVACRASRIVTRNTRHFANSPVRAVTPAEFLQELAT
jgi:hypothetical protein